MKRSTIFFLFLLWSLVGNSQQISLGMGKTSSNFRYFDSQGQSLNNLQTIGNNSMSIAFGKELFIDKLKWSVGSSYSGYGAIGSIAAYDNFLEWNLQYLEFDFGLQLELIKIKNASVYIVGMVSPGYVLYGTQTTNNTVHKIKDVDTFTNGSIAFKEGLGVSYPVSQNLSFFVQYLHGNTSDLEKGNLEDLKIRSNTISFGFLFKIVENNKLADINL